MSSDVASSLPVALVPLLPAAGAKKKRRPGAFRPTKKVKSISISTAKKAKTSAAVKASAAATENPESIDHADDDEEEEEGESSSPTNKPATKPSESTATEPAIDATSVENSAKSTASSLLKSKGKDPKNSKTKKQQLPSGFTKNRLQKKRKGVAIGGGGGKALAIGSSRPDTGDGHEDGDDEDEETVMRTNQTSQTSTALTAAAAPPPNMDEMDAAILAQGPGEAPRMSAFCTRFKAKKPEKNAVELAQEQQRAAQARLQADFAAAQAAEQHTAAPEVRIVNGEIVIQESSLMLHGAADTQMQGEDEELEVVEEEAQLAIVGASYNSFVTRGKAAQWTAKDTQLFFDALRQIGLDFGTMELFFDHKRTRKQLKRKYQMELIKNTHLVEKALDPSSRRELDLSVFQLTEEEKEMTKQPLSKEPVSVEKVTENNKSKSKKTSDALADAELEVVEEDAAEEWQREEKEPDPWSQPAMEQEVVEDPFFSDDPLLDKEEEDENAAMDPMASLVPSAISKKSTKKKPKFRSVRMKKK